MHLFPACKAAIPRGSEAGQAVATAFDKRQERRVRPVPPLAPVAPAHARHRSRRADARHGHSWEPARAASTDEQALGRPPPHGCALVRHHHAPPVGQVEGQLRRVELGQSHSAQCRPGPLLPRERPSRSSSQSQRAARPRPSRSATRHALSSPAGTRGLQIRRLRHLEQKDRWLERRKIGNVGRPGPLHDFSAEATLRQRPSCLLG